MGAGLGSLARAACMHGIHSAALGATVGALAGLAVPVAMTLKNVIAPRPRGFLWPLLGVVTVPLGALSGALAGATIGVPALPQAAPVAFALTALGGLAAGLGLAPAVADRYLPLTVSKPRG